MKEYKRLKEDEVKGLHIIEQSQFELYVDMVLQKNYKENSRKVNILIFNKDTLGSYVVTAKKIDVVNLKDKDYERMAAGVAPAISSL